MEKNRTSFYQPEVSLPMRRIVSDLTRTAVVTILAVVLQLVLFTYLNRGGWSIILAMIQKINF
ncbi:hypothetical protein A2634_00300 [Candidatus Amesbacteria bacterium RIFCSPHIGHO2_01_FULL_48_32]|uniref:Uncharacterized protein n=1 Tax=Candidatus Amesbacteria bacterium RIFCSPLOWO2_01_FULL_48_25 TaxID=1797259 RepID=A0A1F4ZA04_9BACT|nr:MAG: hypothetical protein A2634_00300 [Candidatus Amesbacteria bacterium RIFCSPHIGHO2_01_FULL_48_32]OGD03249.1 MAG: hypothetical protein A2989_00250 [Candidatus Amesbacteria bacterium RIFCSPLOWO2_01_FULL_48_25]HJZ05194.1 hypothetical protein [Patescibacteria group bacterium]